MHFLQAINSDLSVLRVCNKTGGTIKGDIKKIHSFKVTLEAYKSVHNLLHLTPVHSVITHTILSSSLHTLNTTLSKTNTLS